MNRIRQLEFALRAGGSALCSMALLAAAPAARADDGSFAVVYAFPAGSAAHGAVAIDAAGTVYGTTSQGGRHGFGTLYAWSDAGGYVVLHDFRGPPDDGATPLGSLVLDKHGVLWGTTSAGGANDAGTVFRRSVKDA